MSVCGRGGFDHSGLAFSAKRGGLNSLASTADLL